MINFNLLNVLILIGFGIWVWYFYSTRKIKNKVADDLVLRLRLRASIRRQITTRKSVQENKPDRIADLLEEAANKIEQLRE